MRINILAVALLAPLMFLGAGCGRGEEAPAPAAEPEAAVEEVRNEPEPSEVAAASEGMPEETRSEPEAPTLAVYSVEEIALHAAADDCWLLIDGKVYDVTEYVARHPGGKAVVEGCGKDSTELYETRPMGSGTPHSDKAREGLANYLIGQVE